MKLLELFKISRKKVDAYKAEGFSDFFRNAPEEEKKKVLKEAAYRANEDQWRGLEQAKMKLKTH